MEWGGILQAFEPLTKCYYKDVRKSKFQPLWKLETP